MSKVAIVTDTISCLPTNLVQEYNIKVVPVGFVIDRKSYLDNQLSNEEFWSLFNGAQEPVTTTAPNPADFESVFTRLAKETNSICCILVSKVLSATYNSAVMAKELLLQTMPQLKIEVIDSKTATGAQGFIVLEAARAAQAGKDLSEVIKAAQDMIPRVKLLTTMGTLKYVINSGRAPKSAVMGNWLQIKPILGIVNGSGALETLGRKRGLNKSIENMISMVGHYVDAAKPLHVMTHYTDNRIVGEKIKQILLSRYRCSEIYVTPFTPVIASQTGPLVAISFYS